MSDPNNNLPNPTPDDESGGQGNEDGVKIFESINKATGRDYKTDEEALKGVQETTSYVGKVGKYQKILGALEKKHGSEKAAIDFLNGLESGGSKNKVSKSDSEFITREEYENLESERSFYSSNPNLKSYKNLLKSLKGKDESLEDTVGRDDVKEILSKLVSHDKSQKSKSVIHSNSRVSGNGESYQKDLAEVKKTGKWTSFLKKYQGIEF